MKLDCALPIISGHYIFALIDPRDCSAFFVGSQHDLCLDLDGLPPAVRSRCYEIMPAAPAVHVLEIVQTRARFSWVKWSLRLRKNLLTDDWKTHAKELALLVNSNKLCRALGLDVPDNANLEEQFWKFHTANLEVIDLVISRLRELKDSGQSAFGINAVVEELRWEGEDLNRTSRYKVKASNCPFYARLAQMLAPDLCGFVEMSESVADGMTLPDGRTWATFARERAAVLRYVPVTESEDVEDWLV
jgi:hypothetical protein